MNSAKSLIIYTFFIIGIVIVIDAIMKSKKQSIPQQPKESFTINKLPEQGAKGVTEPQKVNAPSVLPIESSSFFGGVSDSFEPISLTSEAIGVDGPSKYFSTIDNPVKPDTAPYQFYEEPIQNKMQSTLIQDGKDTGVIVKAPGDPEALSDVQPFSLDSTFAFV